MAVIKNKFPTITESHRAFADARALRKHQGESLEVSLPMYGWREYTFALNDLSTHLLSGRVVQRLERTPYKRLTIVQLYP